MVGYPHAHGPQRELIGPGLLAIGTPLVVGFLLGPFALGGFLAGMILSGQLLAVFYVERRRLVGQREEDDRRRAARQGAEHR